MTATNTAGLSDALSQASQSIKNAVAALEEAFGGRSSLVPEQFRTALIEAGMAASRADDYAGSLFHALRFINERLETTLRETGSAQHIVMASVHRALRDGRRGGDGPLNLR